MVFNGSQQGTCGARAGAVGSGRAMGRSMAWHTGGLIEGWRSPKELSGHNTPWPVLHSASGCLAEDVCSYGSKHCSEMM